MRTNLESRTIGKGARGSETTGEYRSLDFMASHLGERRHAACLSEL